MKPSEEYTIHILPDEEFEKLPVGKPKEAMGMTDAKRKIAWVRQTGVKDLDDHTIRHEFDELMSGTSLHEEDGIRYKKGGNIFKAIVSALAFAVPGIGPILGPVVSGAAVGHSASQAQKQGRQASEQARQQALQSQSAFRQPFVQSAADPGRSPLSDTEFQTGLGNIDKNLQQRETDIFRQSGFRGQKESENTALARALGSARTSSTSERDLFVKQQEDAKRAAGLI
jgi:hypothetical protein